MLHCALHLLAMISRAHLLYNKTRYDKIKFELNSTVYMFMIVREGNPT